MTAKLTDRERWQRELSSAAPPADVLADIVFSQVLSRETELVAEADAGLVVQDQLDVVRALLRLIFSPNVRHHQVPSRSSRPSRLMTMLARVRLSYLAFEASRAVLRLAAAQGAER